MTLTSEKDLRMSSRVVVVKESTFWVEFWATLWWTTCSQNARINSQMGLKLRGASRAQSSQVTCPLYPTPTFVWCLEKSSTWLGFELGLTLKDLSLGQWRLLLIKWESGAVVSRWACVIEVLSGSLIYAMSETTLLLSITLRLICGPISSPLIQNNSFLGALLPLFIRWPLLKGHMQLSRGHCLGNKGQLLSHDLTKGTAAVNRFYALLMFSRHLFLLTKCFF